ncbi:MAG: MFS transporter [Deltaproteobacteria bacterium]|nr:MFS transporter [Deltaproteobacteria bacterium]
MPEAMEQNEKNILVVTCFGHFVCHFNMLVFPALVLPLTLTSGLDIAGVLGLSFWMYLLFGITALPWGLVADRWAPRPLMMLMFLGAGLSSLAAAWLVDQPDQFSLALAGIGLFSGIYHPAGLGLISKSVRRVAMAMGYNGIFGNLGLATAPLMAGIMNWVGGPRAAYVALGLVNLGGLVLMFKAPPVEVKLNSVGNASKNGGLWTPFLVLLVAMMLGGVAYRGSSVIMPTLLQLKSPQIIGFLEGLWPGHLPANLVATIITSVLYALGMVGQYVGGRTGERFDPRLGYFWFHLAAIAPAMLMGLASDWTLSGLGILYLFFLLGMQPMENTLVARLSPDAWRHSAYGLKFVFTFGVGSLAVKGVGWVQQAWGLEWVFPCLGVVSIGIVAAVAVLLKLTRPVEKTS